MASASWLTLICVLCVVMGEKETGIVPSVGGIEPGYVVITTIDGSMRSVDVQTGNVIWSSTIGKPLLSSYYHSYQDHPIVIPATDGSLYLSSQQDDLEQVTLQMEDLVAAAPLHSVSEETAYLGKKETTLYGIDVQTGNVLQRRALDTIRPEGDCEMDESQSSSTLWFTRVDFHLEALDLESKAMQWNVSYSRVQWLDVSEKPLGSVPYFMASPTGLLAAYDRQDGTRLWRISTGFPVTSVLFHRGNDGSSHEQHLYSSLDPLPLRFGESAIDSSLIVGTLRNGHPYAYAPTSRPSFPLLDSSDHCEASETRVPGFRPQLPSHSSDPPQGINVSINLSNDTVVAIIGIVVTVIALVLSLVFLFPRRVKPRAIVHVDTEAFPLSIGSIQVNTAACIGVGSQGTAVFEGSFQGRPIAVKRMLYQFYDHAKTEVELLLDSDHHANVVRYFACERDGDFVYIALERCEHTLTSLVASGAIDPFSTRSKELARDIIQGLSHLHSKHIIHRDVKPANLLVAYDGTVKIADMGIGRRLQQGKSSLDTYAGGSCGWYAPEILQYVDQGDETVRFTKAVDIFALGCVLYYIMSGGDHPFGDTYDRDRNILRGQATLTAIERHSECTDLIEWLLQNDAQQRPPISDILSHPFFYSDEEALDFICYLSDRVESENKDAMIRRKLEQHAPAVVGERWDQLVHPLLLEDLGKYRKYDYSSLRDLLRVIRNKRNHYRDLSDEAKTEIGEIPSEFLRYFKSKFPQLLFFSFCFVCDQCPFEPPFYRYCHALSPASRQRFAQFAHVDIPLDRKDAIDLLPEWRAQKPTDAARKKKRWYK